MRQDEDVAERLDRERFATEEAARRAEADRVISSERRGADGGRD
jgi:hypothetical protein